MPTRRKPAAPKKESRVTEIVDVEVGFKEPPRKPPFVTQVVEEVPDDNDGQSPLEEIKEDVDDIAVAVEKLEEKVEEQILPEGSGEGQESESSVGNLPDQRKDRDSGEIERGPRDVVGEFFKSDSTGAMPEIDGYEKRSMKTLIVWVFLVLLIALLVGSGLVIAVKGMPALPIIGAKPTPSPAPTPTLAPTPQAPNKTDIKIEVQNGGGKPGAASKMKKLLEDKGYTVTKTGNADSYTYDKTEILVKSGKDAYIQLINEDIKDQYSVGSTSATLPDDTSADARVIVGKE